MVHFLPLDEKNPSGFDTTLFSCKSYPYEGIDEKNNRRPFNFYSIEVDNTVVAQQAFSYRLFKDNYNFRYLKYKDGILLNVCSDDGLAMYKIFTGLEARYAAEYLKTMQYQQDKKALDSIPKQKAAYSFLSRFLNNSNQL